MSLKEEVLRLDVSIEDEETLQLLKNNIETLKNQDVTNELSRENLEELQNMVKEPFGYETISQVQFDATIKQWRSTK